MAHLCSADHICVLPLALDDVVCLHGGLYAVHREDGQPVRQPSKPWRCATYTHASVNKDLAWRNTCNDTVAAQLSCSSVVKRLLPVAEVHEAVPDAPLHAQVAHQILREKMRCRNP